MKKKIGFIDLYINNWHANNYPAWFRTAKRAGEFELGFAYEESPLSPDSPPIGEWCAKMGMKPAHDIETVIANSDCLCVLAPNNPEAHDRLSALPLAAGKPLYIDKTFAPDMPCRFTNQDGVLTYRVFFPAKYLLPMKMQKGWIFGFGLFAPDSDQPEKVDSGLTLALDGQGCWNRPHMWPLVILTE